MKKQKKVKQPLISVIMPVYNAGNYLVESIESILEQSYKNFEFVIVNDASNDNSLKILKKYKKKDKRIRLYSFQRRQGVSHTVKYAIDRARGKYLARMDADDVAYNYRLEKQLRYLLRHPKTVAIGAQCKLINKRGQVIGEKLFPTEFKDIYSYIFKFVPVQQPTLMINKKRLPKDFVYYEDGMNTAEEVELFFKLFKYGKVENLPTHLLYYRIHDKNTSLRNLRSTFLLTFYSRVKAIFVHDYKPTLEGILHTLIQLIVVLILPKNVLLRIYEYVRILNPLKRQILFKLKLVQQTV